MSIWEDELCEKQETYEKYLDELIDRDTPKKPKVLSQDILCGKCGSSVGNNNGWTQALVEFCRYCGTRIDWSEDE